MNPRKPLFSWQLFAQSFGLGKTGFASTQAGLQDGKVGGCGPFGPAPRCCPFPSVWPSPAGVGPLFSALRGAVPDGQLFAEWHLPRPSAAAVSPSVSDDVGLKLPAITTSQRGKTSCGKSLHSFLSQPRLRAVCKTPVRAGLPVRSQARLLPTPPTVMCLTGRSSAALQALHPAPFRARSAADKSDLTATTAAGHHYQLATHGAFPVGGFSISRPMAALT